jgi:hypothetical protein
MGVFGSPMIGASDENPISFSISTGPCKITSVAALCAAGQPGGGVSPVHCVAPKPRVTPISDAPLMPA